MTIINTLRFDDYEDFAVAISNKYEKIKEFDELSSVDIVARYDDAKEIIRHLCYNGYGFRTVDLKDPEFGEYDDEFIISVYDGEIWCEPAKRDGKYIYVETDVAYLMSDCNSAIIKNIDAKQIYEVTVDADADDCDGDCENCNVNELFNTHVHVSQDDDGNTHGFTVSKADDDSYISYSYYTSNALDVDDVYKMLKEFGF